MRIISGTYRGRSLHYSKDTSLRPTQDRVKEAMFDIIQFKIEEARVLDLFCGTGSLGIEALSRGAKHVTFIDKNTVLTWKNLQGLTQFSNDRYTVLQREVIRFLEADRTAYDIVFVDPPYEAHALYEDTLNRLFEFDMLSPHFAIFCEHHKSYSPSDRFSAHTSTVYKHGDTRLTVFRG